MEASYLNVSKNGNVGNVPATHSGKINLSFGWQGPSRKVTAWGPLSIGVVDLVFENARRSISVHIPEEADSELKPLPFAGSLQDEIEVSIDQIRAVTIKAGVFEKGGHFGPKIMDPRTGKVTQQEYLRRSDRNVELQIPENLEIGQSYRLVVVSDNLRLTASLVRQNSSLPENIIHYRDIYARLKVIGLNQDNIASYSQELLEKCSLEQLEILKQETLAMTQKKEEEFKKSSAFFPDPLQYTAKALAIQLVETKKNMIELEPALVFLAEGGNVEGAYTLAKSIPDTNPLKHIAFYPIVKHYFKVNLERAEKILSKMPECEDKSKFLLALELKKQMIKNDYQENVSAMTQAIQVLGFRGAFQVMGELWNCCSLDKLLELQKQSKECTEFHKAPHEVVFAQELRQGRRILPNEAMTYESLTNNLLSKVIVARTAEEEKAKLAAEMKKSSEMVENKLSEVAVETKEEKSEPKPDVTTQTVENKLVAKPVEEKKGEPDVTTQEDPQPMQRPAVSKKDDCVII